MIVYTPEQEYIINQELDWFLNSNEQIFQYDGKAGTGKSFVMNEMVKRMGLNPLNEIAAMSFIGSASILMRMRGLLNAKTIHSWLYDIQEVPLRDKYGKIIMDNLLNVPVKVPKFIPRDYLPRDIKLMIIDEGWTVPASLKKEIEKFGIKILVAGDQGQLPPVNDSPAYLVDGKIYHLTQVLRQGNRADIVEIANRLRVGMPIGNGYYGNVFVIDRKSLTDDMLIWADAIICGKNQTRDYYNKKIRSILGFHGELPQYGEKIVCRKNNWLEKVPLNNGGEISLVNGLIGTVTNAPDISSFDGKMFTMNFVPDIMRNIEFNGLRCNYKYITSDARQRDIVKNNRYETGCMFEFGYALTGWIAQGSQWNNVIYIEEGMHPSIRNQLNYVGATRAVQNLIYVKS